MRPDLGGEVGPVGCLPWDTAAAACTTAGGKYLSWGLFFAFISEIPGRHKQEPGAFWPMSGPVVFAIHQCLKADRFVCSSGGMLTGFDIRTCQREAGFFFTAPSAFGP